MSTDLTDAAEKFARALNPTDRLQNIARNYITGLCDDIERLNQALTERDRRINDRAGIEKAIEDARRIWDGSGRHEPIAKAIERSVHNHLRGDTHAG